MRIQRWASGSLLSPVVTNVMHRLQCYAGDFYPNFDLPPGKLPALMHLFAFSVDLISYLTRFEWDMAKYPIKQPLKNISEALSKVNCTQDFKMSAWEACLLAVFGPSSQGSQ